MLSFKAWLAPAAVAAVLCANSAAQAACPAPFTVKDAAGASQNIAEINDASNNCVFPNAITDGGGAANRAAVKAASTTPAATDPALVVAASPNSLGCAGASIANTTVTPINNAGSSANLKLVDKVPAQKVYVCSINIVAGAATNVALVEGTKTTNECDTSTAGLAGGATAATGWNLAANGGLTLGNGTGIVAKSATNNLDVCLLFSAGNQVSGTIVWAQF